MNIMRARDIFKNDLLLTGILVIISIIVIVFIPSNISRMILGALFALFLPGYALSIAFFPRKSDLEGIKRVAMSFGLSLAVSAVIGLILNYTPWGITLHPILVFLGAFTVASLGIAWQRQRRLTKEERYTISFALHLPQWRGQSHVDKVMLVIVVAAIMSAIGALAYGFTNPRVETFTEFYILGPEGRTGGYPQELSIGETAEVTVVIVNHEHEDMSYGLEMIVDGNKIDERIQVMLGHQEKWEQAVSFTPVETGENQKVEFVLYKGGEPYRRLHLWVNVKERT